MLELTFDRSGMLTPPPSEDDSRCPAVAVAINNINTLPTPPKKRRRDRLSLHKEREANRSIQFTTRLQRSDSGHREVLGRSPPKRSFTPRKRDRSGSEGSSGEA